MQEDSVSLPTNLTSAMLIQVPNFQKSTAWCVIMALSWR